RFQTAQEFGEDLQCWLRYEPTRARPGSAFRRLWLWSRRNKGWAAAIALAAIFVLLLLGAELRALEAERKLTKEQQKLVKEREFQLSLQELQRTRLTSHEAGWSDKTWQQGRDILKLGPSE